MLRIEEYAVECSILKVYGSEMLSYLADEWVAVMGGYGYVEEYPAERFYRDARINRIFEGTNEINRLIITGWLMKRAAGGELPLLKAIRSLMDEVMQPPSLDAVTLESQVQEVLGRDKRTPGGCAEDRIVRGRRSQPEIHGGAGGTTGDHGRPQSMSSAQVYALDSALTRARKVAASGRPAAEVAAAMTGLLADETIAFGRAGTARRVLAACAEGDELRAIRLSCAGLRAILPRIPLR